MKIFQDHGTEFSPNWFQTAVIWMYQRWVVIPYLQSLVNLTIKTDEDIAYTQKKLLSGGGYKDGAYRTDH